MEVFLPLDIDGNLTVFVDKELEAKFIDQGATVLLSPQLDAAAC